MVWASGGKETMKGLLIALGVIVLLVLIVGGSFMGSRNDLVTERAHVLVGRAIRN